jgi:DNA-binding transcriptional ArsR family regulator
LDGILSAHADRVRDDLDLLKLKRGGLGPRSRALYAQPRARLVKVAEEVQHYWDIALAPYWARIRAVLDADVSHRARQAAQHGAAHLLNELHAAVRWSDDTLQLLRRPKNLPQQTAGHGLLLIPSVFTGPGPLTRFTPPDPPQLAYPARGIGALWEQRPTIGTSALTAVLGRTRTLLLTELGSPASTTELARRTGLSPAGVSQNLTALRTAGLVSAHRVGRSVLYARTSVAESVLTAACP